ncbi:uncharacterized protein LOC26526878 [Drosophila erecta]|uniref:Uncharacterized protein n=1 Tax=Drosophila erecta TaxID=7220 RepID=A0A0Q5W159_DROER|nr:uncharacterized protein LOC26526878 [Drosophila erecta]KQS62527.1 uncharacterized protein Dere_GG27054 [Drosophila erecta]
MEHIRFIGKALTAVIAGTLLLLMTAIYREENDSGNSHYIHPRHTMQ